MNIRNIFFALILIVPYSYGMDGAPKPSAWDNSYVKAAKSIAGGVVTMWAIMLTSILGHELGHKIVGKFTLDPHTSKISLPLNPKTLILEGARIDFITEGYSGFDPRGTRLGKATTIIAGPVGGLLTDCAILKLDNIYQEKQKGKSNSEALLVGLKKPVINFGHNVVLLFAALTTASVHLFNLMPLEGHDGGCIMELFGKKPSTRYEWAMLMAFYSVFGCANYSLWSQLP
jgi:hypothetical protein